MADNMNVKDIEARLSYLCENELNNPEIYELLKQLAAIYIFQNRYVYGYSDIDSVCHDVASDTYLRVLSGRTHITKWMYYIGKSIKYSYISKQRAIEHQIFETENNPGLRDAIITMCAGSSKSINDSFNNLQKISFLQNIDSLIRYVMNQTKFKPESKEWWTLYTNVCLSLYYDKVVYFRIEKKLRPYVDLLLHKFREAFLKSEFMENDFDTVDEDLPSLLFYDENVVKDVDRKRDV